MTNSVLAKQRKEFILPDIGEGIVECEIVKWHVKEGDKVIEDQTVVDVMTDKAIVEIPAKYEGVISKLFYEQGQIAKVHQPLFTIEIEHRDSADKLESSKVLASPAVRRIAREHGVELTSLCGSGDKGRILKQDIPVLQNQKQTVNEPREREEKLVGVRAAMARKMVKSVSTIPHFSASDEVDVGHLLTLREQINSVINSNNQPISLLTLWIKSLSVALAEFPIMNSRLSDDGSSIIYQPDHNIGFAVATDSELVVPNIKRVQDMSLIEIEQGVRELISNAHAGTLTLSNMEGGTITLSNIGSMGGIIATPIINFPEVAIVAVGKIRQLPRFNSNGEVCSQQLMMVNWSADHRIIDGATLIKFNNYWLSLLSNPSLLLIHLR